MWVCSHFKNNVLRTRKGILLLSTINTSKKSIDVMKQVVLTIPPNSDKINMVKTEVDTRGNQCSIFEPQVLITRSLVKPNGTRNVPTRVANTVD